MCKKEREKKKRKAHTDHFVRAEREFGLKFQNQASGSKFFVKEKRASGNATETEDAVGIPGKSYLFLLRERRPWKSIKER